MSVILTAAARGTADYTVKIIYVCVFLLFDCLTLPVVCKCSKHCLFLSQRL